MHRCLELALLGAGHTAPNPMVGSVLVCQDRIIGEGYHQQYGQAHAEVNCIASVKQADQYLITDSTLYVSLEPCAHFGKTPPCADLIIEMKIPRVVIGCRDPFPAVDGKGIEKLKAAGVEVMLGVLDEECIDLNRRFFTFHTRHRPFIVLKWAQSANGKIADHKKTRTLISHDYSNRLVHKWRSEEAAILVGTRTALLDDPALTVRRWTGPQPVRLVIDKENRLPASIRLFDRQVPTIVFNYRRDEESENIFYYKLDEEANLLGEILGALHELRLQSVLVEGGVQLLQSFIDEGLWDEARVITNNELEIQDGPASPLLSNPKLFSSERLASDTIRFYRNPGSLT